MQLDGNNGDMYLLYPLIVPIRKDSVTFLILQSFSLIVVFFSAGIVLYHGYHLIKIFFNIRPPCVPKFSCRQYNYIRSKPFSVLLCKSLNPSSHKVSLDSISTSG